VSASVTSREFPTADELSLPARLAIQASATADVALRTAAATVVATTIRSTVCDPGAIEQDAERLQLYRDLAQADDPGQVFPAPDGITVDEVVSAPLPGRHAVGHLRTLRFDSPYVPLHPQMRVPYLSHYRNRTAWAQHWTHADGPRPTIVVVHGFMVSPYWLNRAFLHLPWFYGHGYDILLVTLPFHGRRRDSIRHYSGEGLFVGGISHLNEAIAHGLHDLRAWIGYLLDRGAPRVGMTGISLGGYMTALTAAVDDRLDFAIPNVPVADIADLLTSWMPAGWLVQRALRKAGTDVEELQASMALHCPLTWDAKVPRDRRFVIAGLGDRLAPPSHARALWEHWEEPYVYWFAGNHVLHLEQGGYLRQMGRFLQAIEFAA
jgi:hypothetical protein